MLNPKTLPEKTYESLMEEIYNRIPVYSQEWTNYNASDPGITILENLSAFQILQQNQLGEVTEGVKAALLALLGYSAKRGRCARVLLEASGVREPVLLPADQRFLVGDISFETALAGQLTDCRIIGVYGRDEKGFQDYSFVLDYEIPMGAAVFTKNPKIGMELYFVLDKAPSPEEKLRIFAEVEHTCERNPFGEENPGFASLKWECFTGEGFLPMETVDETNALLASGEIVFAGPKTAPARYTEGPVSGYVWRATLLQADYDVPPVLKQISGFLFEAWQKETLAITHTFQKPSEVFLTCAMLEEGYVRVFGKEEKGSSYRLYQESLTGEEKGRFYRRIRFGHGMYAFLFDREAFGMAPGRVKNAVKIVIYNEEMMRRYYLGEVLGYDDQELTLPVAHVVTETFSLMAVREDEKGGLLYDFVKPGRTEENNLSYYLYENEGRICIRDAGDYIGAKLYVASVAVTRGEEGNVRPRNRFYPIGYEDQIVFTNPSKGTGGCFRETLESVRKRYLKELHFPDTAVMASDYERIVKNTPGLCIDKVHAWMDEGRNEIQVAVKPGLPVPFPTLSPIYLRQIQKRLEERRLLSAKVRVRQPVYVGVVIQGKIGVKPYFENCRKQIEAKLHQEIDYEKSKRNFGEKLEFDRVLRALEGLDCVSYVHDLTLRPTGSGHAQMDGANIRPENHCLLYVQEIRLDIHIAV